MADDEQDLWVELETNKGTKYTSTYRGRIDPKVLEAWAQGELGSRAIRLDDVHWADYGEGKPEIDTILGREPFQNFTGTAYFRADTVVTVLVLRDGRDITKFRGQSGGVVQLRPR